MLTEKGKTSGSQFGPATPWPSASAATRAVGRPNKRPMAEVLRAHGVYAKETLYF